MMSAQTDKLTDAEIDVLLERFDQTDPKLQRRCIAEIVARCAKAQDACTGMADRLREYCKELRDAGMRGEAANVERIASTLEKAGAP